MFSVVKPQLNNARCLGTIANLRPQGLVNWLICVNFKL